eukprot:1795075-Amphidinium_carterae.2
MNGRSQEELFVLAQAKTLNEKKAVSSDWSYYASSRVTVSSSFAQFHQNKLSIAFSGLNKVSQKQIGRSKC